MGYVVVVVASLLLLLLVGTAGIAIEIASASTVVCRCRCHRRRRCRRLVLYPSQHQLHFFNSFNITARNFISTFRNPHFTLTLLLSLSISMKCCDFAFEVIFTVMNCNFSNSFRTYWQITYISMRWAATMTDSHTIRYSNSKHEVSWDRIQET